LYCSNERLKENEKGYWQEILPVVTIEVNKEHVWERIVLAVSLWC